jgi:hypothetical protein
MMTVSQNRVDYDIPVRTTVDQLSNFSNMVGIGSSTGLVELRSDEDWSLFACEH